MTERMSELRLLGMPTGKGSLALVSLSYTHWGHLACPSNSELHLWRIDSSLALRKSDYRLLGLACLP